MMADAFFSFTPFDFYGSQGAYFPLHDYEEPETEFRGKEGYPFRIEDFGDFNLLSGETSFDQQKIAKNGDQTQPNSDYLILEEMLFNNDFTITESIPEKSKIVENPAADPNNVKPSKQISNPCLESLQLLCNYGPKFKNMKGTTLSTRGSETRENNKKLSTEEILRVAGARYVQFFPQGHDTFYMPMHPFGFSLSGLSEEEIKDVELAHILFAAAEKVDYQQYDRASKLLQQCEWIASPFGNAVQRLVFYFAKALRRRIERETGRTALNELKGDMLSNLAQGRGMNLETLKGYQKLPFHQVMQLTAVQTIFEHIKLMSKVHLIDLEIRSGVHWAVFMQSLVDLKELPIRLLKITAVGLDDFQWIEKVGESLQGVAKSLNIPFLFKRILVSDMMDIKEKLFEIEDDEMVAIYSPIVLRTMISRPNCLENLMRVIRNLKPSIMVVLEVEANHNSPLFINRFIELLFFKSAYFDCLDTYMEKNDESRRKIEALFGEGIQNVVATESSERIARSVKIEVWRAFFARFRMDEIELSESCFNQAKLMAEGFACSNFCSLEKNGKCLIVGWKETPLLSVSAWEFL